MTIFELLQHTVNEPASRLTPEGRFPKAVEDFVDACLSKRLLVGGSSNCERRRK